MGELQWTLFPAHTGIAGVRVPEGDWLRIRERGWITIRGCRAVVLEEHADAPGWICFRIRFDEPYPFPHP